MPKTIMIVDDSTSLRQVLAITQKGADCDVVEAYDGKDVLAKRNGRKLHLIVTNVKIANRDGLTFLKAAKQPPAYKFTPVIMLTTEAGEGKKAEDQAAGAKA
ncbi:MAG TPA: response regulator [Rhodocyclaceae bacterium]|nr:response regulator [Rhodocyclaceae bacterium]